MFRTSTIDAVYSIKTFEDTADLVGGEDPNEKVYKGEALMSYASNYTILTNGLPYTEKIHDERRIYVQVPLQSL